MGTGSTDLLSTTSQGVSRRRKLNMFKMVGMNEAGAWNERKEIFCYVNQKALLLTRVI